MSVILHPDDSICIGINESSVSNSTFQIGNNHNINQAYDILNVTNVQRLKLKIMGLSVSILIFEGLWFLIMFDIYTSPLYILICITFMIGFQGVVYNNLKFIKVYKYLSIVYLSQRITSNVTLKTYSHITVYKTLLDLVFLIVYIDLVISIHQLQINI